MAKNDYLLRASFRGAGFFVSSISMGFGRKGVMHEAPFNNTPFYEDLGRKGRTFTVEAYVMANADEPPQTYEKRRDALISAIEDGGAGRLVHPTMGNMVVVPIDCRTTFNNSEGRMERLSITFAEEGERTNPKRNLRTLGLLQILKYTGDQAIVFADTGTLEIEFWGLDANVFADNYTVGKYKLPDSFLKSLTKTVEKFTKKIDDLVKTTLKETGATDFSKDFLEFTKVLSTAPQKIMGSMSTLLQPLKRIMFGFSLITTSPLDRLKNSLSIFGYFFGLAKKSRDKYNALPNQSKGTPKYRQLQSDAAIHELILSMAIAEVASASLDITVSDAKSMKEYKEYVNNAFNDIALFKGDSVDQNGYIELLQLQATISSYFDEEIKNLPSVKVIVNAKTLPSLVIAYNYYEDSDRNDEFIDRNSVSNPNSVPVGNLEVLAE